MNVLVAPLVSFALLLSLSAPFTLTQCGDGDVDNDGFTVQEGDCDDHDRNVYPGAPERCNGLDDDCDLEVDEGVQTTFYQDGDGDGYGSPFVSQLACSIPEGYVTTATDCDDADAICNPGVDPEPSGVTKDLNCDGVISYPLEATTELEFPPRGFVTVERLEGAETQRQVEPVAYASETGISGTTLRSTVLDDPETRARLEAEHAVFSDAWDFSSSEQVPVRITLEFDASELFLANPDGACAWLGIYQIDASGAVLEGPIADTPGRTDGCILNYRYDDVRGMLIGRISAELSHFSIYAVLGEDRPLAFEPVYAPGDVDNKVSVGAGDSITRSWRFEYIGGDVEGDLEEYFHVVPACIYKAGEGGSTDSACVSSAVMRWEVKEDGTSGYRFDVSVSQKASAGTYRVDALVYFAGSEDYTFTDIYATDGCSDDAKSYAINVLRAAGTDDTEASPVPTPGPVLCEPTGSDPNDKCFDFDGDGHPDPFDCLVMSLSVCSPKDYYADDDGDEYGDPESAIEACEPPSGYVENDEDCNDEDADVHPGVDEICDAGGVDEDCDGFTNDLDPEGAGGKRIYYHDGDGDGFGGSESRELCIADTYYTVTKGNDCNDGDAFVYPGAAERCNGIDDSCDGATPSSEKDNDDDGQRICAGDCNDTNASINSGATEIAGDSIDQNCDGKETCYADKDNDGYRPDNSSTTASTDTDCADPYEATASDPIGDCNDSSASVRPGATETCNGKDDNCNGSTDEGVATTYFRDNDGDRYGALSSGSVSACSQPAGYSTSFEDCNDANPAINPGAQEGCNKVDDNCDGWIDDAPGCLEKFLLTTPNDDTYLVGEACTWSDAEKKCAEFGYDLVTINDSIENQTVRDVVYYEYYQGKFANVAWIGCYRSHWQEDECDWDDGQTSTYTNWRSGDPIYDDEYQSTMLLTNDGRWASAYYDYDCMGVPAFVCQAP